MSVSTKLPSGCVSELSHTLLSLAESMPQGCGCLMVGTGAGWALLVIDDVWSESSGTGRLPDKAVVEFLNGYAGDTNAVLHIAF